MMELSCDPSSIADSGNKNDKSRVRGLRSAHHSRNFEASISARVDSLEDRLIETSHTLEKILEIVSSSAFGKVRIDNLNYFSQFLPGRFEMRNLFVQQKKT